MKQKRGAFTLFVEVQSDLTEEACASSTFILIFFLNFSYSLQFSNPFTTFGRVCKN